jgi:uncharacterized protein (DUF1684 family)
VEASTAAPHVRGNLVEFNKDHQRLVFVTFPDAASGKGFVAALLPDVRNAKEVLDFNRDWVPPGLHGRDGQPGECTR